MASFFDLKARKAEAAIKAAQAVPSTSKQGESRGPVPWVEKYRPKKLEDVTAQDNTINVLKRTLQSSNLPHMLFYGPPGTGKTSTILALAKELYGPELMKTRVLELNASDERGISIVREKIKNFARIAVSSVSASYVSPSGHPPPPYKIIILDEADSMTQDAQSALRRTMETYSKITRFCLVCNYVTRIIDPLASRCSKFRFKPLDQGNAVIRVNEIATIENVKCEDGVVEHLVKVSDGDLRKAITFLQSAAKLHAPTNSSEKRKKGKVIDDDDVEMGDATNGAAPEGDIVTIASINEIAGVIPEQTIDLLLDSCEPKTGSSTYKRVSKVVEDIILDGWSAAQILLQVYDRLVFNDALLGVQKNKIVGIFSEVDKRLSDGADEHLAILDMALRISAVLAT